MEGKGINISKLTPSEQKFMQKFNKDAMMNKKNDIVGGCLCDLERLTQRFELLKGEMNAGNDSKKVKNEISGIINKLVQLGALKVKDAVRASKHLIADV
jgi:ribosomal protein S17E